MKIKLPSNDYIVICWNIICFWTHVFVVFKASKDHDGVDGVSQFDPPSEYYRFGILIRRSLKLMFRDWVSHIVNFITTYINLIILDTGGFYKTCSFLKLAID